MRLTCPNCGAQYEVPGDVIPQTGRDVQCSNCSNTWFQAHGDEPAPGDDVGTAQKAAQPASDAPPSGAPVDTPEQTSGPTDPTARPGRREIDPAVASVLREEAQREKRARAAAQGGLETQPDLGLEETSDEDRRSEVRARVASLRGEDSSLPKTRDPAPQDIDPTSRRSLFPDIEEINSSLAPGGDRAEADHRAYALPAPDGRTRFRRGFLAAVLIAVAALLIYVFAPQLADMLPALRGVLGDYVNWIDGLRQWLDGQIAALMLWLDGMASTAPAPTGDSAPD
ncbi:zinc-ribbon domain-containing protein [Roseovarius sp. M141]|uniref:zinc-ribbon domain-containing protein n=1 Tax=Roseovarius sp. M141 TaxID=2583806 RepID=UPI0020CEB42D|nr:zinc-ribbon domain-containing protein [Roseovarius sp. M141]MCQ0092024.1 hypothetical protein [Roseovarius sp. M141]